MPRTSASSWGTASGLTDITDSTPQNRCHLLNDAPATKRSASITNAGDFRDGEAHVQALTPAASRFPVTVNHVAGTAAVALAPLPSADPIRV